MMHVKLGASVLVLAGLAAAPVLAQEICPTVGTGAVWMAGDQVSSDVMAAAAPFDQSGLTVPPNGSVLSAFSVTSPGEVRVEALPQPGGDTVIELYAADGRLITTDDDGGGNLASRAETFLDPGTYCLLTRGFGGGAFVADVRVGRTEMEALTQGIAAGTGFFAGVETCTPATPATRLGQGAIDALLSGEVDAGQLDRGRALLPLHAGQPPGHHDHRGE